MEMFRKASSVRLRSHHDKYLLANEDEKSVTQARDGSSRRAIWRVELVDGSNLIRLKSCYGKFLTASDVSHYLGMTGKKVIQTFTRKPDSSTEWEPIREGVQVKLKSRYGYYLRANGGLRPWRNSVTHNIPRRSVSKDLILWEVDVVKRKKDAERAESIVIRPPWSNPISRSSSSSSSSSSGSEVYFSAHPSPEMSPIMSPKISQPNTPNMSPKHHSPILSPRFFPNLSSKMSPNMSSRMSQILSPKMSSGVPLRHQITEGLFGSPLPAKSEGRLIWYKVAGESFAEMDETMPEGNSLHFRGSEVEELKVKLAKETGLDDEEFIVCSRNPVSGRLYPLKLDLPPNHSPMSLFVVPSSSEVAKEIASWDSPLGLSPDLRNG